MITDKVVKKPKFMLGDQDKVENNPASLVEDARHMRKKFSNDSDLCAKAKSFESQKAIFMSCIAYINTLTTS